MMRSQVLRVVGMECHSSAGPDATAPSIVAVAMSTGGPVEGGPAVALPVPAPVRAAAAAMCSRMIPPFRQQRPPNGGFRRVPLLTEAASYPRVGANTTTRRIRLTRRAVLKTAKQSIGARCRPTSDLKLAGSTRSSRLSRALRRRGAYCPIRRRGRAHPPVPPRTCSSSR